MVGGDGMNLKKRSEEKGLAVQKEPLELTDELSKYITGMVYSYQIIISIFDNIQYASNGVKYSGARVEVIYLFYLHCIKLCYSILESVFRVPETTFNNMHGKINHLSTEDANTFVNKSPNALGITIFLFITFVMSPSETPKKPYFLL